MVDDWPRCCKNVCVEFLLLRSASSKGEWLALTRLVSLCVNSFLLGGSRTLFPVLEQSVLLHIGSWVLCHASGMDSGEDQRLSLLSEDRSRSNYFSALELQNRRPQFFDFLL